jgi:superfamily II DNA or RNA helicase
MITNNKSDIIIKKINSVHVHVECSRDIAMELYEHFTFMVPGAKFMPTYKSGFWDGKVRMFNLNSGKIYYGLKFEVARFAETRGYTFSLFDESVSVELNQVEDIIEALNLPMKPYDYQVDAIHHAIKHNRALLVSPTASGKSLIIYCLARYHLAKQNKVLILVPTTSLVSQLHKDFKDYGFDSDTFCHQVTAGVDKISDKPVIISTWQSVYKMGKEYFAKFDAIFVDECHLAKAKSLSTILEKMTHCDFKYGLTGTLDGTETNKLTLSGLFDVPKIVTTTKKLIDDGAISNLKVNCLILNHSKEDKKIAVAAKSYQEECDYLVLNKSRNQFISRLATSLKGNTLVLFSYVEKHGMPLKDQIAAMTDKEVRYVSGIVKAVDREETRAIAEKNDDVIIVASYATFSTGINIKNLHNIVFAFPTKSQVRVLQSIGRGLRTHKSKDICNVYDIADDIRAGKRKNYTMNHFNSRVGIYRDSEFDISMNIIDL